MKKKDPIYKSKRVLAAITAIIVAVLTAREIEVPTEQMELITAAILSIVAAILDIASKIREGR